MRPALANNHQPSVLNALKDKRGWGTAPTPLSIDPCRLGLVLVNPHVVYVITGRHDAGAGRISRPGSADRQVEQEVRSLVEGRLRNSRNVDRVVIDAVHEELDLGCVPLDAVGMVAGHVRNGYALATRRVSATAISPVQCAHILVCAVDVFHDVELAVGGPTTGVAHHPEGRPDALSHGDGDARFHLPIQERAFAGGGHAGRGHAAVAQGCAGFHTRFDDEHAAREAGVGAAGVILPFAIAPTRAARLEAPVAVSYTHLTLPTNRE